MMRPVSRMNIAFVFVVTLLFLLALTTVFMAQDMLVWKLSILATEYGHWFALLSLFLVAVCLMRLEGRVSSVCVLLLLGLSIFFFSRPYVQAQMREGGWTTDLQTTFGLSVTKPLLSFQSLWMSRPLKRVKAEHIVFSHGPSGDLDFNFYRPRSSKPTPWIVVVHGGGWDSGDAAQLPELNYRLVEWGYAVASVSYRLAPAFHWPAQRDDVMTAVTYIKNHASELNIDPTRWVILGRSAGGQIAQAVGYQNYDASLKGVIAYYSPADLKFAYDYATDDDILKSKKLLVRFVGGSPDELPALYKDGSPINFVSHNSPPTLLFHGEKDPLTWCLQSRRLSAKLKDVGARFVYLEFPWGTHAFDFNLNGPAGQVSTSAVEEFLKGVFR